MRVDYAFVVVVVCRLETRDIAGGEIRKKTDCKKIISIGNC